MELLFTPGVRVKLTDRPEWGEGWVQSVQQYRVTVNFLHHGKVTIDTRFAKLELL